MTGRHTETSAGHQKPGLLGMSGMAVSRLVTALQVQVHTQSRSVQDRGAVHKQRMMTLGLSCRKDSWQPARAKCHPRLFVYQARYALDATAASQPANGRLGDALDVITEHLPVALGTTLSKTLSSLATSCTRPGGVLSQGSKHT